MSAPALAPRRAAPRDWTLPVLGYAALTAALKAFVFTGANLAGVLVFALFLGSLFLATSLRVARWAQLLVAVGVLLVGVPLIGLANTFYLDVAINLGIFSALALGLNIVVGFAGLLDLGYVAFFAAGAYLWGIFGSPQANNFTGGGFPLPGDAWFLAAAGAVLVAALFGVLLGLPVLRLKGDYLAIVTLGLGEIIRVLANNLDKPVNLTNGPQGITPIGQPLLWLAADLNRLVPLFPAFNWSLFLFYLIALAIIGLAVFFTNRLDNSRIGRAWVAIREDEVAAQAMGVPLVATKLVAFATGASFAGAVGALFAAKQTFISPESFDINQSIGVLAMVVLGGLGSIRGAIVGATLVTILNLQVLPALGNLFNDLRSSGALNLPAQFEVSKYQRLIFGVILVVMMIYRPQGLVPARRRALELTHGDLTSDPMGSETVTRDAIAGGSTDAPGAPTQDGRRE